MRRGAWMTVWVALGVTAGVAHAQLAQVDEAIRLDYTAAPGCPDRDAFEARVRAHTTRAHFVEGGESRAFAVDLAGAGPVRGRLTVRRGGRVEGERAMQAEDCTLAANAVALMVALAIDPSARLDAAPPAVASVASAIPPPVSAPPEPAASTAPAPPPRPPARPTIEFAPLSTAAPAEAPAPAPPREPPSFAAGIDLAVAQGISPAALVGPEVFVAWRAPFLLDLAPDVRGSFARAGTDAIDAGSGQATFSWTVGRVDGCVRPWSAGPLELRTCLRLEAGALEGHGAVVRGAHSSTRGWFAVGPLARLRWDVLAPLFVEADLAGLAHVTADRFYFDPDTTVVEVPFFGATAAIGLGVRFL